MNINQQLKLQSHLDGELSPRESQEVAEWLAADAEARSLFAELKNTSTALTGNELEIKLPESREFFFSKIQRQIEREAASPKASVRQPMLAQFWKYVLPLAGATAAVILFAVMSDRTPALAYVPGEGETSSDMAAYTYRSQADRMTVVWLADNNAGTTESDASDATEIQ